MAEQSWKIPREQIDAIMEQSEFIELDCFGCCTVVVMKLPNGFTLVEKSGTISPGEYDPQIGRRICRENLRDKVWELEGYVRKNAYDAYQRSNMSVGGGKTQEMPVVKPTRAAID